MYYSENIKLFIEEADNSDRRKLYRLRFTTSKLWLGLLTRTAGYFGHEYFTGLMARYKNPKTLVT